MSGLLKADSGAAIRPIQTTSPAIDAEIVRLNRRIDALESDQADSAARIEALTEERDRAYEQGRAAALREADDGGAARLRALEDGIADAGRGLGETFAGAERLAALLARECLVKLFTETDDRAGLICDLIHRQIGELERSAVLAIAVSAADFPDAEAIGRLASLQLNDARIDVLDTLAPGACTIGLRLGRIEIGLDRQWGALAEMLTGFADMGTGS